MSIRLELDGNFHFVKFHVRVIVTVRKLRKPITEDHYRELCKNKSYAMQNW